MAERPPRKTKTMETHGPLPFYWGKEAPPIIPAPYSFLVYAEDMDEGDSGPFSEDGPSILIEEELPSFPPIQHDAAPEIINPEHDLLNPQNK